MSNPNILEMNTPLRVFVLIWPRLERTKRQLFQQICMNAVLTLCAGRLARLTGWVDGDNDDVDEIKTVNKIWYVLCILTYRVESSRSSPYRSDPLLPGAIRSTYCPLGGWACVSVFIFNANIRNSHWLYHSRSLYKHSTIYILHSRMDSF